MEALLASAIRQMYTAGVNDTDPDERSEYDMKNEIVVEKRHDMA